MTKSRQIQLMSTLKQGDYTCCRGIVKFACSSGPKTEMLTPPAHVTPDEAPLVGAGDCGRLPGRPCMPRWIHGLLKSLCACTADSRLHTT